MKKIFLIVLLIGFICVGCSFGNKSDELDFHDDRIDKLEENHSSITKVVATRISEGGNSCYDVTEYKDNIYNSIINMKAVEKHSRYVKDDGLIYDFILSNNEHISFEFNGGSYVKSIDEIYELEKTRYEIKYDKEIGCDLLEKE